MKDETALIRGSFEYILSLTNYFVFVVTNVTPVLLHLCLLLYKPERVDGFEFGRSSRSGVQSLIM